MLHGHIHVIEQLSSFVHSLTILFYFAIYDDVVM